MSRVSTTAKRYTGSSYSNHYSSYGSSLTPGLSSYKPSPSSSSSTGYSSSSYLSSSSRPRNYSSSSEPEHDRGRPIPRSDLLGSSSSRRSESLSRAPIRTYGTGLSGGAGYSNYNYSSTSSQPSYLSSSPVSSSFSLSRRKSVSQSDLSRDLSSLGLTSTSAAASSSSSSSALSRYRSRTSDVTDLYIPRSSYSGLSRSATQEVLPRSSAQEPSSSSRGFTSSWERNSNGRSSSPSRDSSVRQLRENEGKNPHHNLQIFTIRETS